MQLFRFENENYLYLLLAIPLLVVLWVLHNRIRSRKLSSAGDKKLVSGLMPETSLWRNNLKYLLLIIAWLFAVLMISRPQFGSRIESIKREGVEIIIALDVSNSMLAEDIQPNRLERAKQSISKLVDRLNNDKIGLIVFAGDAYTQIPVTTDYVSAKMFLSSINPSIVPKQGTSIGAAIELGMNSFSPTLNESKALIIITDGENHEDNPVESATKAADKGIIIHTIGIGSQSGVPIPINSGSKREYLKDNEGNTVITKLDEETLKEIAFEAGGKYVRASNSNIGLNAVFDDIGKMKQQELESTLYSEYNDQFQYIAGLILILLIIEFVIMERRNRKLSKVRVFEVKL